jgi:hypothetical protein
VAFVPTLKPSSRHQVPKMRWFRVGIPESDPRVMGHLPAIQSGSNKRMQAANLIGALKYSDTSYLQIRFDA